MDGKDFEGRWNELAEDVMTGMAEWRVQHPRATFRQIETALDERLARMRARMLQDLALASSAADWDQAPEHERPLCPQCGQPLERESKHTRHLQTQGGQDLSLERRYGSCPACGAGLFPPG
jgi:ribosomal protein S27AE